MNNITTIWVPNTFTRFDDRKDELCLSFKGDRDPIGEANITIPGSLIPSVKEASMLEGDAEVYFRGVDDRGEAQLYRFDKSAIYEIALEKEYAYSY